MFYYFNEIMSTCLNTQYWIKRNLGIHKAFISSQIVTFEKWSMFTARRSQNDLWLCGKLFLISLFKPTGVYK